MIKNSLLNVFQGGNADENLDYPLHEMAAYPKCNGDTTETSWLQDNNVTIQFSNSLFEAHHSNLNLDSAILRLYKINPNATDEENEENDEEADDAVPMVSKETTNDSVEMASSGSYRSFNRKQLRNGKNRRQCSEPPMLDSQIRITVSIVQQLRRNKRGAVGKLK